MRTWSTGVGWCVWLYFSFRSYRSRFLVGEVFKGLRLFWETDLYPFKGKRLPLLLTYRVKRTLSGSNVDNRMTLIIIIGETDSLTGQITLYYTNRIIVTLTLDSTGINSNTSRKFIFCRQRPPWPEGEWPSQVRLLSVGELQRNTPLDSVFLWSS